MDDESVCRPVRLSCEPSPFESRAQSPRGSGQWRWRVVSGEASGTKAVVNPYSGDNNPHGQDFTPRSTCVLHVSASDAACGQAAPETYPLTRSPRDLCCLSSRRV